MNEIVNKVLLAGDKSMPKMHLRQPGFSYTACGTLTKNKERIQKFKETEDSRYIYQKELDKACFQHDMDYGDFKDLPRRTGTDKVLCNKGYNFAKKSEITWNQRGLTSMICKFFHKKTSGGAVKSKIMHNQQLVEELQKPIIRKFKKRKVHSSFIDNIWGAEPSRTLKNKIYKCMTSVLKNVYIDKLGEIVNEYNNT